MKPSDRANSIREYYFSTKLAEVKALNDAGKNIINLGIGSPDLAPDASILQAITDGLDEPDGFKYQSYKGLPELRKAIHVWYENNYTIQLHKDTQVIPLLGSKEGIGFLALAYLNEGDEALIPNPGYPTNKAAIQISGAVAVPYTLEENSDWHPQVSELEKLVTERTKIIFTNYPHMPTGQAAHPSKVQKIVDFALKHNLLLCNDNPYSNTLSSDPFSIFQLENAEKCCVELNSLSKSHSMAGARIGILIGNENLLYPIFKIQSSFSSGMFKPLQRAAIKALDITQEYTAEINEIYRDRKALVFKLLDTLGCSYNMSSEGLFVWARIPTTAESGEKLSDDLLYKSGVFITPGMIFGTSGYSYIRVSLCQPEALITEAISRITTHLHAINN